MSDDYKRWKCPMCGSWDTIPEVQVRRARGRPQRIRDKIEHRTGRQYRHCMQCDQVYEWVR